MVFEVYRGGSTASLHLLLSSYRDQEKGRGKKNLIFEVANMVAFLYSDCTEESTKPLEKKIKNKLLWDFAKVFQLN